MSHSQIDWMEGTPCSEDPDAFQLPSHNLTQVEKKRLEHAKALCLGKCLVPDQCLVYALDNKIKGGIWGGMTDSKRQRFLRDRKRQKNTAAVEAGLSTTKR